jgi:translation elongation factor EF-1alpha
MTKYWTNEDKRNNGNTVEVGRAWFETKKHLIILDVPDLKWFCYKYGWRSCTR